MAARILRTKTTVPNLTSPSKSIPTITNKNPKSLTAKTNSSKHQQPHNKTLFNLLQRYGLSPPKLHTLFNTNNNNTATQFLLTSNLKDIEKSLNILMKSLKVPKSSILSLISDCPGVLELDFLRKWELGFSKFGDSGCSPLVFKSVLEHSRRFQTDPDSFFACLRVLKGLGFSEGTVCRVLDGFPRVIMMKERELNKKIEFVIGIGLAKHEVDSVCRSFPEVLGIGVENRLKPLIDEFGDLGFSKDLIREEIIREPRILGMELGELSRCLDLLRSLKCREPIKLDIFRYGSFRAGLEVKLRIDLLCNYGLIRREAFGILWKEPRAIIYDRNDIEKKIMFLLDSMQFEIGCLVDVPEYLGVNFEKQIVPRYNVIEHLRGKGALGDEVGLKDMIKLSRLKFYNLYVKPYPECEKMFTRFSGDGVCTSRHPVGLWKLFRVQYVPESEQDVENIKSFMEVLV